MILDVWKVESTTDSPCGFERGCSESRVRINRTKGRKQYFISNILICLYETPEIPPQLVSNDYVSNDYVSFCWHFYVTERWSPTIIMLSKSFNVINMKFRWVQYMSYYERQPSTNVLNHMINLFKAHSSVKQFLWLICSIKHNTSIP